MIFVILTLIVSMNSTHSHIMNGIQPKGIPHTLVLEEDLRFGGDSNLDVSFWPLTSTTLAVDKNGHMFVCDPKANMIHEFDQQGLHVRSLGGAGQGPGEFTTLTSFQIHDHGAVALEVAPGILPKLSFFDDQFAFLKRKMTGHTAVVPTYVQFNPAGELFAASFVRMDQPNQVMFSETGILDLEYQTVHLTTSHQQHFAPQRMGDSKYLKQFITDYLRNSFAGNGVFGFDTEGNLLMAFSDRYQITKLDPTLKRTLLVTEKRYQPIANNDRDKFALVDLLTESWQKMPGIGAMIDEAFIYDCVAKAGLSPVKNPVMGLIAIETSHFLVVRDIDMISGMQKADLFDGDGVFIGTVSSQNWAFVNPLSLPKMVFKNGYAYTVESKDEVQEVVRYRYRIELKMTD